MEIVDSIAKQQLNPPLVIPTLNIIGATEEK